MLFQSSIGLIIQNPDHTDTHRNFIRDIYRCTRIENKGLSIFEVLQRQHETGWSGGGFPCSPNTVNSLIITSSEDVMLMWRTWKTYLKTKKKKKAGADSQTYKWNIAPGFQIEDVELELAGYDLKDDVHASLAFADAFTEWHSSLDADCKTPMSYAQLEKLTSEAVDKSFEEDGREIRDSDYVYAINDVLQAYHKLSFDLIYTKNSQTTVHRVMMLGYVTNILRINHDDYKNADDSGRSKFTVCLYRMRRSLAAQYWLKTYRAITGESTLHDWFDTSMVVGSFVEQQLSLFETSDDIFDSSVEHPILLEFVSTLSDVLNYRNADLHNTRIVCGDPEQLVYNTVDVELGNVYPVVHLQTPAFDSNGDEIPKTTFMIALNKMSSAYDGVSFGDYPPVEFAVELEESNLHKHGVLVNCATHCIENMSHVQYMAASPATALHPKLDIKLFIPNTAILAYVFYKRSWVLHVERFDNKGEFYKIDTRVPALLEVYVGDGMCQKYKVTNLYVRFNQ